MALLNALYGAVIFLSALLLFLVEPMTAKRLLPELGGSAAVWTTCLVFFQTALLGGYLYAHLISSRLRARGQAIAHTALLALAAAALMMPVRPEADGAVWHPLATTLWLLTALIGLPFMALAATTPLVQSWYARQGARPGWRLYALSNLGSMLALVLYPWLIETHIALQTQRLAWGIGFGVFAAACVGLAWRAAMVAGSGEQMAAMGLASNDIAEKAPVQQSRSKARAEAPIFPRTIPARRVFWVLLPAASSMLLCAITAHLSQNIAAIPLLWIVPLAAYLLSFILTFAGPAWYPRSLALRTLALAVATLAYLLAKQTSLPLVISIPTYVGALFVFCYFCHGELYRLRPVGGRSTEFYLLLSLGSALGAMFVGVAAPVLFRANYDLALSLIFLVAVAAGVTWGSGVLIRIFWCAATAATIWAAALQVRAMDHNTVSELRSFYGSLRVTQTFAIPGPGIQRTLYHGTIEHGEQVFNDQLRAHATSYYAPDSGVGLAIRFCCGGAAKRIGVVGLGAGTLAAYPQAGDSITFYEIDPLVERLARARFAYLRECKAPANVVLGDARISMQGEPPQGYDVLALDAFSGDAIPVHLLTAEAIALYRRHLKPDGVLAFHISSQYVDLAPVLAAEAQHAGLRALAVHSLPNDEMGEFQADWVLMTARESFFDQPEIALAARPIELKAGLPLWTDDLNSLLPLVKWTGIQDMNTAPAQGK